MRYILLTLAAFLLIAAPAFAGTTGSADISVTVNAVENMSVEDVDWEFTISTIPTTGYLEETTGVDITGYANYDWKVMAYRDGWSDTNRDWTFELKQGTAGTYAVVSVGSTNDIQVAAGNASGTISFTLFGRLGDIGWDDEPTTTDVTDTVHLTLTNQ